MATTIPPIADCTSDCSCTDPVVSDKCYSVREALPVCSTLSPSSTLQTSSCTRLDHVYDDLLLASIVPNVGSTTTLKVCNASLYTVGNWIQFVDGSGIGSIFQIVSINTLENILTVRNALADGVSPIAENPSPGSNIETNSRFAVVGEPRAQTQSEFDSILSDSLSRLDEICLDNIRTRVAEIEEASLLGTILSSECAEGDARPCLRKLQTKETKDGSIQLGALNPEAVEGLTPLYANGDKKVVSGGSIGTNDYVSSVCGGSIKIVKNGKIFVPFFENIITKATPDIDNLVSWSEVIDLTTDLTASEIELCSSSNGAIALRAVFQVLDSSSSVEIYRLSVNGVNIALCSTDTSSNSAIDQGFVIVPIPSDRKLTISVTIDGGGAWKQITSLIIDSAGVFV